MIDISGENVVLVGALLLFVAVMAGKVAYRFGAPALLLFLGVGMLFGLNFISYRSVEMTQFVGMIALCIILFTGGMDTKFSEIKPIIGPGVVLATVGVVMTAFVLAGFVWLVAPWLGIEIPFALALLLAVPLGLFTAVYLNEYAKRGNKLVNVIRITTETLSGIPSIVYGLFGMLFFVTKLHWGYSLLAGAMTLAIMILPLIMRTAEEALMAVPDSYREGSFGLGAGRLRTVFRIVLPAAGPGILSGVILGIGRIVGETAALIFTAGTMAQIPGLFQSGRTLAIHMYVLSGEALHMNEANATAVVLLLVVLLMNTLSALAAKKLTKK